MTEQIGAFLIVERGNPYHWGEILPLREGKVLLGRGWEDQQPDISFDTLYVSRFHARIDCTQGLFTVTNLPSSKHGTKVNGLQIDKDVPHTLKDGDKIQLAEEVVVVFCSSFAPGETLDYPSKGSEVGVALDEAKRRVIVDGRPLPFSGKPYELFRILWLNRGRAVSDDMIRIEVWPERAPDPRKDNRIPLVGDEEISALVHRLRSHLGEHGGLIRTIRGYGYLLE